MKRRWLFATLLISTLCLVGVGIAWLIRQPRVLVTPAGQSPNSEIVFVVEPGILGFIRSDGSGYETKKVTSSFFGLSAGANLPVASVTWGETGQFLAGRYHVGSGGTDGGIPFLITADGVFEDCPLTAEWPYGTNRVWAQSNGELLTVAYSEHQSAVVTVDLVACTVTKTLYTVSPNHRETLREASLSTQGWLAIHRWVLRGSVSVDEVLIIASDDRQYRIEGASFPAWSADGEWLVYSGQGEGLYIADKFGEQQHAILLGLQNYIKASWSPDGRWLAYSRGYMGQSAIYKVEVATGAEQLLHVGGYDPDWRWSVQP